MNQDDKVVRVATGVMVFRDKKILLGKRKNAHGAGEYGFPGGKLHFGESIEDCVSRELREECAIEIANLKFLYVSNEKFWPGKQFVKLGFTADWASGEPTVLEPDKCESWDWYLLDNLPEPLFEVVPQYLEAYRTGRVFFDS